VEDLIADYITEKVFFLVRKPIRKALEPVFLADPSYITSAFDAIEHKYGDFKQYYMQEYGISEAETHRLRESFTE